MTQGTLLPSRQSNPLQVIQLHNAFLSAALERSLLLQADVVQHTHALLAAAKELAKMVESCDVQHSGEMGPEGVGGRGGSVDCRGISLGGHVHECRVTRTAAV